MYAALEACQVEYKTLNGFLRAGVADPPAEQQDVVPEEQDLPPAHSYRETLAGEEATEEDFEKTNEWMLLDEHYGQPQLGPHNLPMPQLQQYQRPLELDLLLHLARPKSPARFSVVTINFLADGERTFEEPEMPPFCYYSYRATSTSMTVDHLINQLRPLDKTMRGVTVITEKIIGRFTTASDLRRWNTGITILQDSEMAGKTLAEVGWGSEMDPVWLISKLEVAIHDMGMG